MSEDRPYDQGGYIPGGPVRVFIDPDECLIRLTSERGPIRCSRPDHPTPTSDCGRAGAPILPPAEAAR